MNTTIAAVSTPYGKGGIAVIRISGDCAVQVAEKMFFPVSGSLLGSVEAAEHITARSFQREW